MQPFLKKKELYHCNLQPPFLRLSHQWLQKSSLFHALSVSANQQIQESVWKKRFDMFWKSLPASVAVMLKRLISSSKFTPDMCSQDRLEQKHFQHACILLICKNYYQRFRKMKTTWSTPFPVLEALAEWSERIFGQISESKECQTKPTFVAAQHSNVKNRTNRKEVRTTENTLRKYNSHEISNAHL